MYKRILGTKYFIGTLNELLKITESGVFIVVPSAPVLAKCFDDRFLLESIDSSDFAIIDSSVIILSCRLAGVYNIHKISGYLFLSKLIEYNSFRTSNSIYWIMPNENEMNQNIIWLKSIGVSINSSDCYVSPLYIVDPIIDIKLLNLLQVNKPKYIIICIGGGVQEKLGYYLKKNLYYRPTIICTGAAIAFLSGVQTKIPFWADKFYMGWMFRILDKPFLYIPRYFKSTVLIWKIYISIVTDSLFEKDFNRKSDF